MVPMLRGPRERRNQDLMFCRVQICGLMGGPRYPDCRGPPQITQPAQWKQLHRFQGWVWARIFLSASPPRLLQRSLTRVRDARNLSTTPSVSFISGPAPRPPWRRSLRYHSHYKPHSGPHAQAFHGLRWILT